MASREQVAMLEVLFAGLSDADVAGLSLDALRHWRRQQQGRTASSFSTHGEFAPALLPLLSTRANLFADPSLANAFILDGSVPSCMNGIFHFFDWFVRAGFAFPFCGQANGYAMHFRLTKAGARLLEGSDDLPAAPQFVERIRSRCPGLSDDVVALLTDARTCLEHMLLRPAVVVMGVAYETAVEAVMQKLVAATWLQARALESTAKDRIRQTKAQIDNALASGSSDDRTNAHAAYDFAELLRGRRNDASHTTPRYGFDDREEIEEFLQSAGRHLPALWSVGR